MHAQYERSGEAYPQRAETTTTRNSETQLLLEERLAHTAKVEERQEPRQQPQQQVREAELSSERPGRITLEHILRTALDLDNVAKSQIEKVLSTGSRKLADDLKETAECALRAIEQNANLLRIIRTQMGFGNAEDETVKM
jgi:hypothetical protein